MANGWFGLVGGTPTMVTSRRLAQLSFRPVLLSGLVGIGVVGGIGAWDRLVHQHTGRFDLDLENSTASAFSAFLLLLAAAASVLVAASRSCRGARWPWLLAAAGLTTLAVDERRMIHERLESAAATDWQVLYLPIFVAGGVLGVVLFRQLRISRLAPHLFLGAASLWGLAQILESVQWDGDQQTDHYEELMVVEELAEMSGSLVLAVSFLDHARGRTQGEG